MHYKVTDTDIEVLADGCYKIHVHGLLVLHVLYVIVSTAGTGSFAAVSASL